MQRYVFCMVYTDRIQCRAVHFCSIRTNIGLYILLPLTISYISELRIGPTLVLSRLCKCVVIDRVLCSALSYPFQCFDVLRLRVRWLRIGKVGWTGAEDSSVKRSSGSDGQSKFRGPAIRSWSKHSTDVMKGKSLYYKNTRIYCW